MLAVALPDHGLAGHAVPGAQVEDWAQTHGVQPPAHSRRMQSTQCADHSNTPLDILQLSGNKVFIACRHEPRRQAMTMSAA